MTPKEEFDKNVWLILQEIYKEYLMTRKGEPVEYRPRFMTNYPEVAIQIKLLNKLSEWGAFDLKIEYYSEVDDGTYLLKVEPNKFNEIYAEYKKIDEKYQEKNNPKPKVEIPKKVFLPLLLEQREDILHNLLQEIKRTKFLNQDIEQSYEIGVGWEDDFETVEEYEKILNEFKKTGWIRDFDFKSTTGQAFFDNGTTMEQDGVDAVCKIVPAQFLKTLKIVWSPQKDACDKLAKYHYNLIKTIELYFQNDQKPDAKLNKIYEEICEEIRALVWTKDIPSPRLKFLYHKPFHSLFMAAKELKEDKITIQEKINKLTEFYGVILAIKNVYDAIDDNNETELEQIENYLNSFKPPKVIETTQKEAGKNELSKENLKENNRVRSIPSAADYDISPQKIIHQHIHEFANSIQEKELPAQKVEIIKLPDINIKNWEQNVVLPKPKDKKIQLRKFPKDLKWEQITITFLNGQEVIIKAQNETLQTTYEQMGFQDEKKKLPNKQWMLLRLLAGQNGELSWSNNSKLTLKQINAIKQQKKALSDGLKAYFQISSDPFWDYKKEGGYKIKINLMPESNLSAPLEKEIEDIYKDEDSDDFDTQIKKSFARQTPEKYKDEKYNEGQE